MNGTFSGHSVLGGPMFTCRYHYIEIQTILGTAKVYGELRDTSIQFGRTGGVGSMQLWVIELRE